MIDKTIEMAHILNQFSVYLRNIKMYKEDVMLKGETKRV